VVRTTTVDPPLNVALVIPLQGPLGMIGPAGELCAQLAAEELNAAGGILGREVRLSTVDGGAEPESVAMEVRSLVARGQVDAVIGAHTSAVRHAIVPGITDQVPYVYTSLYEGGERNPSVFLTGETPAFQLLPGMRLLAQERQVRSWFVVGDDYVWPRTTAAMAHGYARACGGQIIGEAYVPLGSTDFTAALDRLERSTADGVLVLLVGEDAVHFHRAFARRGLHHTAVRLTPLMDENMLLAAGADATIGLFAAAGYFETLTTPERMDFAGRYARRFGVDAPTAGNLSESCYEGVRLLDALMRQARSPDVHMITAVADDVSYEGARGLLHLRNRHTTQRVYLAEADALELSIVAELRAPGK